MGSLQGIRGYVPRSRAGKTRQRYVRKTTFRGNHQRRHPGTVHGIHKSISFSPYVRKAQDRIFELTTPDKSLEQFTAFVRLYPDSPYAAKAWDSIYKLWFSDFSDAEVMSFRSAFPRSPLGARLEADIKTKGLKYFPILSKDKMYGFVNSKGEITVNPQYDFVDDFSSACGAGRTWRQSRLHRLQRRPSDRFRMG